MFKHTFHAAVIWILVMFSLILFAVVLFFPLRFAFASEVTSGDKQLLEAYQNREIVRIHIIANSSSSFDQAVKIQVRDAVLAHLSDCHFNAYTADSHEVLEFLSTHLAEIESIAVKEAADCGFDGFISSALGEMVLPQKTYGNITLPAGVYQALKITLGEGRGENWWGVLFPDLCSQLSIPNEQHSAFHALSGRIFRNWLLYAK